ncbi:glycosyl hydrolase family 18 protein [Thermoanaerobacterium sp. RBIITD]|uniref:glycosyl hydrolase family 18 protein n=1 Tax=Thermoanaerobacterium sp. RBIITD TaxID=1550240 RepID=UPI000BB9895F|nr:glycosyl hydrolase family 18 protein [Thermoanaerobacterium sp. RBIITD]SNX54974.1 Spore germination protein YaaH [Thermoanaerobacterium sp. RBIITD]
MSKSRKRLIIVLLFIFVIASFLLTGCKKAAKKPFAAKKSLNVVGFYVDTAGYDNSYSSLVRYAKNIDTLSPLWLTVQGDGTVKDSTNPKALDFAKKNGLKVVPLVNVADSKDSVLTDSKIKTETMNELISLLKKHNFDGYNIDFEFIPHGTKNYVQDKDYLTAFIGTFRMMMKKEGKILDISVIPHYQVSPEISGIYDYHKLAPLVDHVTLMTYDRHNESSPPGPVSPAQWVEYNVKDALNEGFKPKQICLGVATYGYDWPANKTGGFSSPTKTILQKAKMKGVNIQWSNTYHEPYYTYYDSTYGVKRQVWFENSTTMGEKIDVAKKYGIHGICIWRIGFETPSFWSVIVNKIGSK